MLKSNLPLLAVGAFSLVANAASDECKPAVEVLQIQDVSHTFDDDIRGMVRTIGPMIESLKLKYPVVKYGVASFSDKGLPAVGYGAAYGAWEQSGYILDECYQVQQPITDDIREVIKGLVKIVPSGGADFEEAQLDALLNSALDPNAGFTVGDRTSDNVYSIAKLSLMITDAFPHKPGYVQEWIDNYNAHYGVDTSVDWCVWSASDFTYSDWITLRQKQLTGETLTDDEKETFELLNSRYAPYLRIEPATLVPFEYTAESYYANGMTCHQHDYPDVTNPGFGKALNDSGIFPIILAVPYVDDAWANSEDLSAEDKDWEQWVRNDNAPVYCPNTPVDSKTFYASCTEEVYSGILKALDVPAVLQIVPNTFTPNELIVIVEEAINVAVEHLFCVPLTTTTTTSTTTTTETTTTTTSSTAVPTMTRPPIIIRPGWTFDRPTRPVVSPIEGTGEAEILPGFILKPIDFNTLPDTLPDHILKPIEFHPRPSVLPEEVTIPQVANSSPAPTALPPTIESSILLPPAPTALPPTSESTVVLPPAPTTTVTSVPTLPETSPSPQAPEATTKAPAATVPPRPTKPVPPPHGGTPQGVQTTDPMAREGTTTVVAAGGGPSTGMIVGAAAAGVLVAGAAAGLMYMKGIFGGAPSGGTPTLIEDVEMPENPASREVMEQVTADMFT